MTNTGTMVLFKVRNLLLVLLTFQFSACTGQVQETSVNDSIEIQANTTMRGIIFPKCGAPQAK